jgi:3',5'-cyclic AMP phosphodiesterase CpdA
VTPPRLRVGVLTDLHLAPLPQPRRAWHNVYDYEGSLSRLHRALEAFAGAGVDLVAVLGDVTEHGDSETIAFAVGELERRSPAPVLVVPGNHDLQVGGNALGDAAKRTGGRVRPAGWAPVEVAGIEVVGVAANRTAGRRGYLASPPAAPAEGTGPVIVLSHFPVLDLKAELRRRGLKYSGNLNDRAALAAFLAAWGRPVVVLGGHLHVRRATADGPILQLMFGAQIEPPHEYAIVDIAGGLQVEAAYRTVPGEGRWDGLELPLLSAAESAWAFRDGAWREAQPSASTSGPERSRSAS